MTCTKIVSTKTESGFSISFPYELKDNFRGNFPSAKWDRKTKQWNVGTRSGKRLEQWVEGVLRTDFLEQLAVRDESDLCEKDLQVLLMEIGRVQTAITNNLNSLASIETRRGHLIESQAVLEAAKDRLAETSEHVKNKAAELKVEKAKISEKLSSILHISSLENAEYTMSIYHEDVGSTSRGHFEEAQEKFRNARESLRMAGLRCEAIEFLARANFNRPDRDHPKHLPENAWFDVSAIENT